MAGLPGNYVIDGPANFFGRGDSSCSFPSREAFYARVKAYRDLGRTVTVHENHTPVFAVVEPLKAPVPAFDMARMEVLA